MPEHTSASSLTHMAGECFMMILQIRAAESIGDIPRLRAASLAAVERFRQGARGAGYRTQDIDHAAFALAAFFDEAVLQGPFEKKEIWLEGLLQQELFGRNDGGVHFFQILDELCKRPQEHARVLELFFLCLAMGFKGDYIRKDRSDLQKVVDEVRGYVARPRADGDPARLSPHGRPDERLRDLARELPLWVIGAVAGAMGLLFFLVMSWLIGDAASEVVAMIEANTR